jgi:REP element-mobilizing transposase RayT
LPRPLRLEVAGGVYHAIARGNEKKPVFRDDEDRLCYIERLIECTRRFEFRVYAYCLMENHVHLAIERGPVELSRIMLALHSTYAQRFNRRYGRVGHLFQGRYKAFLIEKEAYLLTLIAYIHMNPVKAGLVGRAEKYHWSSARYYDQRDVPIWLDTRTAISMLGGPGDGSGRGSRRSLVAGSDAYEAIQPTQAAIIGSEQFARETLRRLDVKPAPRIWSIPAIAASAAASCGLTVDQLRARQRIRGAVFARSVAGYVAREYSGIPVARVARFFERDESTLVRPVLKLEGDLPLDSAVRRRVRDVVAALERSRLHG